jgi:hypothetical protein
MDGRRGQATECAARIQTWPGTRAPPSSCSRTRVSDDPDVWTFTGTKLHQVGDYFGDAILAEP